MILNAYLDAGDNDAFPKNCSRRLCFFIEPLLEIFHLVGIKQFLFLLVYSGVKASIFYIVAQRLTSHFLKGYMSKK